MLDQVQTRKDGPALRGRQPEAFAAAASPKLVPDTAKSENLSLGHIEVNYPPFQAVANVRFWPEADVR